MICGVSCFQLFSIPVCMVLYKKNVVSTVDEVFEILDSYIAHLDSQVSNFVCFVCCFF